MCIVLAIYNFGHHSHSYSLARNGTRCITLGRLHFSCWCMCSMFVFKRFFSLVRICKEAKRFIQASLDFLRVCLVHRVVLHSICKIFIVIWNTSFPFIPSRFFLICKYLLLTKGRYISKADYDIVDCSKPWTKHTQDSIPSGFHSNFVRIKLLYKPVSRLWVYTCFFLPKTHQTHTHTTNESRALHKLRPYCIMGLLTYCYISHLG